MAKAPTITTVQSGFNSQEVINNNFQALADAFENTLSLDGSTPNAMEADLDLNGNNVIGASGFIVNGQDVVSTTAAALAAANLAQADAEAAVVSAESSATSASSSATAAANSASAAATSETNADASADDALASETAAAISATNAANSASAAAVSATSASASATNAATSAANADASADDAAVSATAAASSATAASASADAALAALDSFDDRYLGQKTTDPTLDNDGNPLVAGALYFNTNDGIMKVYDGSIWVAAYASLSGAMFGANNLSDVADVSASRTNLGLGTAATTAATDYATAAQGALADTAVQPADLATVATSGDYNDLINTPSPFDPNTLATVATTGSYTDLINIPANIVTDAAYVHTDNNYTTAEQSKLAGIEAGATADQTAAEILTAIKTVDGAGSNLDADTLDGQHGSYYYPASNPNGYITSAPAPSTAQVLSATAGASAGAVGSYALLGANFSATYSFGSTHAGSNLRPAGFILPDSVNIYGSTVGSALSGTWRCLGNVRNVSGYRTTLWLRIS